MMHGSVRLMLSAYRQANQIAQDWFDRTSFLTHVWHERHDQIDAVRPYGARVITYPETVGLTSLLSSPSWTSLLRRGDYYTAIPAFLREAGRRIGHPYPDKPRNDPLRHWAFSQWAGKPAREPRRIDWLTATGSSGPGLPRAESGPRPARSQLQRQDRYNYRVRQDTCGNLPCHYPKGYHHAPSAYHWQSAGLMSHGNRHPGHSLMAAATRPNVPGAGLQGGSRV
jgi:hypothetical protein